MKKYLGLVKIEREDPVGLSISFKAKKYDDPSLIEKWFSLYPDCEHIMLNNTKVLDSMFDLLIDYTPLTEEEFKSFNEAKKLIDKMREEERKEQEEYDNYWKGRQYCK